MYKATSTHTEWFILIPRSDTCRVISGFDYLMHKYYLRGLKGKVRPISRAELGRVLTSNFWLEHFSDPGKIKEIPSS